MPATPSASDLRALLLHGAEPFLVSEESRRVQAAWTADLVSDFGFEAMEPSGLTAGRLAAALGQAPFLDPHRVVVVRWAAPARTDGLAPALAALPVSTRFLITVNGRLTASSKLVKAIAATAGGRVIEMSPLKGRRLSDWTTERARALGLPAAIGAQVVRLSPPDLGVIDSELRKLAAYQQGGGRLEGPALADLLAGGREEDFFKLSDQLVPRPGASAWMVVRRLTEAGWSPTTIGYRLARHLSLVLEVSSRRERGESLSVIQAEMREHPFVVEKAFNAGRLTTPERLERQLRAFLTYEWEVKSGQVDAGWGLEAVLARL